MLQSRTFLILYSLHISTTIALPIGLLQLGYINSSEAISLIVLLAGLWTFVGVAFMRSEETRMLRRVYLIVGVILAVVSVVLYVSLLS